jgi:hypothetical protein
VNLLRFDLDRKLMDIDLVSYFFDRGDRAFPRGGGEEDYEFFTTVPSDDVPARRVRI